MCWYTLLISAFGRGQNSWLSASLSTTWSTGQVQGLPELQSDTRLDMYTYIVIYTQVIMSFHLRYSSTPSALSGVLSLNRLKLVLCHFTQAGLLP